MATAISHNSPKPTTPAPMDDHKKTEHKDNPETPKPSVRVVKSVAPATTASPNKVVPSAKGKPPASADAKPLSQVGRHTASNDYSVSLRTKVDPTDRKGGEFKAGDATGESGKTFVSTKKSSPMSLVSNPHGKSPEPGDSKPGVQLEKAVADNPRSSPVTKTSATDEVKTPNPKGDGTSKVVSTEDLTSVKLGTGNSPDTFTNAPLSLASTGKEGQSGPGAGSDPTNGKAPGNGSKDNPKTAQPPSNGETNPPSSGDQPSEGKNPSGPDDTPESLADGRPVGDQTGMPDGVVPRNRMLTGKDLPKNATNEFTRDPASFAASYFVNTMSNFVMPGRTVPEARPGQTVNGADNVVGFTMNRVDDRNVEMTVTGRPSELGRQGTPSSSLAYYVPFTNGGATTVRVPRNPTAGDPQFVVTGPFTGCSFYVQQDPSDPNSLLFTHDPRRGVGTTTSPTGIPDGAVGMGYDSHYGNDTGMSPLSAPSATAFAAYDQGARRWTMYVQDATVDLPPPGTRSGGSVQRQREEGRIQGAFIPIDFSTPSGPPANADQPGTSNPQQLAPESSFWAAFRNGALTGAAIGGAAGVETGPGAAVTAGGGALLGGTIAGMAWLFSWSQHHATHP